MSKNIVRCRIIRRERVRHLHREIWEKAMRYAKSEDFIERKDHIISLLRHVEQMDLSEMLAVIKIWEHVKMKCVIILI